MSPSTERTEHNSVIHRNYLVDKSLSERFEESLNYVIKAVNEIKSSALNERLFAKLCLGNDDEYSLLLLYTEVLWLSRSACLDRNYLLLDSMLEFIENKDLIHKLIKSKNDIAYLTDLFARFGEINLKLKGDKLNLITSKSVISAFTIKLLLYKQNLSRKEYHQFYNLFILQNSDEGFLFITFNNTSF